MGIPQSLSAYVAHRQGIRATGNVGQAPEGGNAAGVGGIGRVGDIGGSKLGQKAVGKAGQRLYRRKGDRWYLQDEHDLPETEGPAVEVTLNGSHHDGGPIAA